MIAYRVYTQNGYDTTIHGYFKTKARAKVEFDRICNEYKASYGDAGKVVKSGDECFSHSIDLWHVCSIEEIKIV